MSKKLIVAISAALISTRMAGAVPDPDTANAIEEIEILLDAQNLKGICEIATGHGRLTDGQAPLAVALRDALAAERLTSFDFGVQFAANNGRGKGRGYVPWNERPGKGRKDPPPGHPHIY